MSDLTAATTDPTDAEREALLRTVHTATCYTAMHHTWESPEHVICVRTARAIISTGQWGSARLSAREPDNEAVRAAIAHVEMQPGATFTQEQVLGTLRSLVAAETGGVPQSPELTCGDCQQPYATWFADNEVWNLVIGGPDAKGDPGGMLCPRCFTIRAEKVYELAIWHLRLDRVNRVPQAAETGGLAEDDSVRYRIGKARAEGYQQGYAQATFGVQALCDQVWRESQADHMVINHSGIMQDLVHRFRALLVPDQQTSEGSEEDCAWVGRVMTRNAVNKALAETPAEVAIVVRCPACNYFLRTAVAPDAIGTHGCAQCDGQMEVYVEHGSPSLSDAAPEGGGTDG